MCISWKSKILRENTHNPYQGDHPGEEKESWTFPICPKALEKQVSTPFLTLVLPSSILWVRRREKCMYTYLSKTMAGSLKKWM